MRGAHPIFRHIIENYKRKKKAFIDFAVEGTNSIYRQCKLTYIEYVPPQGIAGRKSYTLPWSFVCSQLSTVVFTLTKELKYTRSFHSVKYSFLLDLFNGTTHNIMIVFFFYKKLQFTDE